MGREIWVTDRGKMKVGYSRLSSRIGSVTDDNTDKLSLRSNKNKREETKSISTLISFPPQKLFRVCVDGENSDEM